MSGYAINHVGQTFTPSGRVQTASQRTTDRRNRRLSREEVARFRSDPPGPVLGYLRPRHGLARASSGDELTTWMGDRLLTVTTAGDVWTSNMGDRRQSLRALGIDGRVYAGTAYLSAGDYVRLRPIGATR
jgi:hypothetical protein